VPRRRRKAGQPQVFARTPRAAAALRLPPPVRMHAVRVCAGTCTHFCTWARRPTWPPGVWCTYAYARSASVSAADARSRVAACRLPGALLHKRVRAAGAWPGSSTRARVLSLARRARASRPALVGGALLAAVCAWRGAAARWPPNARAEMRAARRRACIPASTGLSVRAWCARLDSRHLSACRHPCVPSRVVRESGGGPARPRPKSCRLQENKGWRVM
jgi:hypothetical protein